MRLKIAIIVLIAGVFALAPARAQNEPFFGSQSELSKGRNVTTCTAGLRQFMSSAVGFEDLSDYWRDLFLTPMHYADVAAIENHLNRTRYAVVSTFLRCDLEALSGLLPQYYKLEAELYYVRHYVDTSLGYLHILTENKLERKKFSEDMIDYMLVRKNSQKIEEDMALFGGYFDVFEAKYRQRAKQYMSFGKDPIYEELLAKFGELIDTLKSFRELGGAVAGLGGDIKDAAADAATSIKNTAVSVYESPTNALKNFALEALSRFRSCPDTDSPEDCPDAGLYKAAGDIADALKPNPGKKKSFEEAMVAISSQKRERVKLLDKAEMLARYEVLYGQVNGDGITEVLKTIDRLNTVLGKGQQPDKKAKEPEEQIKIPGSLDPLGKMQQCAQLVLDRECK